MTAARRLPTIQRRTFLPDQYTDKKVIDQKYPEAPSMSEAEDPGMVSDRRYEEEPKS
jgi:NADH dehydrogenase (ubiquinone) 1 beta subcomplex subunit 8